MVRKQFNLEDALKIQKGEKSGKIVTRDGKDVRIVCTDAKGDRPIVALMMHGSYEWPGLFTTDGRNDVRENVTTNSDLLLETEGGEDV